MTRPVTALPTRPAPVRRIRTFVVALLAVVLATQALSAEPAAAMPRTVSGTVSFGSEGDHPEGVSAKVTWEVQSGGTWTPGPADGVSTDAQGRYSIDLEPGSYRLRFTPSSTEYQSMYWKATTVRDWASTLYVTAEPMASAPVTGIDTTLPRTGSISGRVFLGGSERLAAAGEVKVTAAYCSEGGCQTRGETSTSTDGRGTYSFTGLVNGTYTVSFSYVPGVEFLPPKPLVVTVSNWQQQFAAQDVTFARTGTISGIVRLGADGALASADEVIVTAKPTGATNGYTTRTDADGRYRLAGLPLGGYDLLFDYAGSAGFADQVWPRHPAVGSNVTNFTLDTVPSTRDITLPKAASLSGTVRDAAGAPISGVSVLAKASVFDTMGGRTTSTLGSVVTGADGAYTFRDLPPASYEIKAWIEQGYVSSSIRPDLGEGEVRTGADVTMYRFTRLSGTIRCDGCGSYDIAPRLGVRLERNVGTRAQPVWVDADFVTVSTNGQSAHYDVRNNDGGLVPGIYRARVVGDMGLTPRANASPPVTVADGADVTLDLAIEFLGFDRDFSGDELPDVLVRTSAGAMLMYTGDGASGWRDASTIGSGWTVMNHVFAAGDFSGDGYADVMARDATGRLHLYRGDGEGGWLGWGVVGTGWGHLTAIFSPGDFSGDGNADVMARDGAGDLWLYTGDGKGGWGSVSKVGSGWNMFDQVFAAGDFGGSGGANVMGRTPSGDLWVYPSSGSGGWTFPARVGTGWNMFDAVFGAGDFDGDGFDDVMGRDRTGRLWLYPGRGGYDWGSPAVVGTGWGHLGFVN